MKINVRVPWYSIAEVTREWGLTVENLHALATAGELELTPWAIDGADALGITAAERDRFEAIHSGAAKEHQGKVQTLEFLLGCALLVMSGEDPSYADHPYSMREFLMNDATAVLGISAPQGDGKRVFRTNETDAEAIRGALARVRTSGLYRPRTVRDKAREIAEALRADAMRKQQDADRLTALRSDRDVA